MIPKTDPHQSADNYGTGYGVQALVLDRFAAEDAARRAWLDEQCRLERQHTPEPPPQARPRTPRKRRTRAPGQTHCGCGRELSSWNRSGACYFCSQGGPKESP